MFCMYIYNTHILIQNWLLHQVFWRTHFNNHGLSYLYSYHSISPVPTCYVSRSQLLSNFLLTISHSFSLHKLAMFLGQLVMLSSSPSMEGKARQGKERFMPAALAVPPCPPQPTCWEGFDGVQALFSNRQNTHVISSVLDKNHSSTMWATTTTKKKRKKKDSSPVKSSTDRQTINLQASPGLLIKVHKCQLKKNILECSLVVLTQLISTCLKIISSQIQGDFPEIEKRQTAEQMSIYQHFNLQSMG